MKVKNIFVKSKAIVFGMKYIPIIATILATIHIGLLLMGHYEPVTISVATVLLLILMILISIRFHFCKLHKAMVVFMALMVACIGFQTKGIWAGLDFCEASGIRIWCVPFYGLNHY